MQIPRLDRRAFAVAGVLLLVVALWLALPWFSAARGVERAWGNYLSAIEDKDFAELSRIAGADYSDGFGLDREGMIKLATSVRGQFVVCTVRREHSEVVMDPSGKSAVTRALIRLGGQGSPAAQAAIQASAAFQTPTTFRWRRNSWKPWDWRLVSIDNPEAARAIARFQREASALGLVP